MMKNLLSSRIPALLLALALSLFCSSYAFGQTTVVIQNNDAASVGFNDPTSASPVGGNPGTTIGQQRLNAVQHAAAIWGATLPSSPVIVVRASWTAFSTCEANTGTLASAGTTTLHRDFPNAVTGVWYGAALANMLSGADRNGSTAEVNAQFNINIGTPGCLQNSRWYYGLDTNHASNEFNLVTVILHEFGHGLGFASFTDEANGAQFQNFPSVFDLFLLDTTTGKTWPALTNAERVASAISVDKLVWNGPQVLGDAGILTAGKDAQGRPLIFAPNPVRGGSSVSHWDRSATPNQLMEPNISSNLTHSVTTPQDLTFSLLRDIGWCVGCPPPPPPPPPANDNFANGQVVSGCSGSVNGTNVSATRENNEPNHSPDNNGGTKSVWYKWQAPSSSSVTFTTVGSNYDTVLAIYEGSSVNALTLIDKNDDIAPGNTSSSVTFTATASTVYSIAVDGYNNGGAGGDTGNITLNWNVSNCNAAPPAVLIEEGTVNRALALDSVTQVRGPFPIIGVNNFSVDQRTRVMIFTTNLGLNPGDDLSALSVVVQGVSLPIERVGPQSGVNNASYIVVRLTDSLPAGDLSLTVTLSGATSNTTIIGIVK